MDLECVGTCFRLHMAVLSPDLSDKGERELAHLLWAPLAEATNLIHKDPTDNPITLQRPYL